MSKNHQGNYGTSISDNVMFMIHDRAVRQMYRIFFSFATRAVHVKHDGKIPIETDSIQMIPDRHP